MSKLRPSVVAVLSFASSVIAGSAFAGQMYVNNLATPDATVPKGTYGNITVTGSGYKATAFSEQTAIAGGSGSYRDVITTGVKVNTHTVSGWFSVTLPTDESLKTIYFARNNKGGDTHCGYRLAVDSDGVLYVGKTGNRQGTTWQDGQYKKTTSSVVRDSTWTYVAVALEVDASDRQATPHVFVNGSEVGIESGTFAVNLNGDYCLDFLIGADVSAAGLYIDTEAVTDTTTIIGWATDSKIVEAVPFVRSSTFTGWLTTSDQLIWENVRLSEIDKVFGTVGGKAISGGVEGPAYFVKNLGTEMTLQFHHQENGYIKGVVARFTQVGNDVYGKAISGYYKEGTVGETDISDGTAYGVATSDSVYYYGVHGLYATAKIYSAETAATKWSKIDNWQPVAFVSEEDVAAKLTLLGSAFDFDEGATARAVIVDSASDVELTASTVPAVARYDLSGCTAKSTLSFDPGDAIVVAGSATKVTEPSATAEYFIGSGKRLYVENPAVAAEMKITQTGVLGYWGTFDIDTPINTSAGEGIEYAGTHVQNNGVGNGTQPTYFSGTVTVKDGLTFVNGTSSDLRIIGGETLLAGKALLSHGGGGANITVSGGVLKGTSGATNPYIYYGGWSGVINLSVNGTGRWEAAIRPHANWIGSYTVTIDVSEQGVFAPSALAFENNSTVTAASGTKLQVRDGGTFAMPTSVPYWIPEEVISGTATNVITENTEMVAPLTVAEGATLVICGPEGVTLSLSKISGTGTVIVEGATLDLSSTDYSTFAGSISTTGDGKILPEGLGADDAFVSVTTAETISAEGWTNLQWKGFFGAPVDPSVWSTGVESAHFVGSGRVEIGAIVDEVRPSDVLITEGVTVAVDGASVLPGTIANAGTIEYTGTQSFGDARVGVAGNVTLAGEHAFTLANNSVGANFKTRLSGLSFTGSTVFTNTAATGFVQSYTDSSAPLKVTGGTLDLGNLYLYAAHEDNAHTWNANLSNDAIMRGGFICWGYYWYAICDIVLNKGTRLETPMGPMNGGSAKENGKDSGRSAAYTKVNVYGSATFAPAYLKTTEVNPILKDYEPTGKYANNLQVELRPADEGNAARPTFELPEVVPSWVEVDVYAPGAQLLIPEGRSVTWNAYTWSENSHRHLWLKGAGTLSPQEKGTFAGTSLMLDGPTVVIGDRPIICRDFTYVSGAFQRRRGTSVLVETEVAMSDDIVTSLPPIDGRNYVLSNDKKQLLSVPKPDFLILFK